MNSTRANASPKFKNLCFKQKQSPKELKEKMRKNYKDKVQNSRKMLLDRFRGPVVEEDICSTLNEIYKSMFNTTGGIDNDEVDVMEELRNELVQEELEWWLREYEKSEMESVDWSTVEEDENVICPVCQKINFKLENSRILCMGCKTNFNTQKTMVEIKKHIISCIEKHNAVCSHEPQFTVIPEACEAHIYLICNICSEMTIVL